MISRQKLVEQNEIEVIEEQENFFNSFLDDRVME